MEPAEEYLAIKSQRVCVHLTGALLEEIASRAAEDGLPLASVVKLLAWRGIRRDPAAPLVVRNQQSESTALAALVCAEQVLGLLEAVLPEGRTRAAELRLEAVEAAGRRLVQLGLEPPR